MGGHAVRYYGIDRNTIDFDLVTSLATPEELRLRLPKIESLAGIRAEPVWRSRDFARFEIGRLPDGREEWLEFWIRNHLLGDFQSLKARAEVGVYGGEPVAFLSIADLLKSKETERESDWSGYRAARRDSGREKPCSGRNRTGFPAPAADQPSQPPRHGPRDGCASSR